VIRSGAALFLLLACGAGSSFAHVPSARECREAGEFIYHAAQDADGEALLVSATEAVFDAPQSDAAHRRAFEARCTGLARR